MSLAFVDQHKEKLASFQNSEERFVWGRLKDSGALWLLEEDTGAENRAFVKANVFCPVPGCGAALTSAHYAKKRDHLRHLTEAGGHSRESVFHSQGCALVQSWLARKYPNSLAVREEYTNEAGERRADVLFTGRQGDRIAFEIQYSPLTPDEWQRRHDSYRRQGIVDVWLFGHTRKQLRIDSTGWLDLTPTHEAVLVSGSALMFINPNTEDPQIAIATSSNFRFNVLRGGYDTEPVQTYYGGNLFELRIFSLQEFSANVRYGLSNPFLLALYQRSEELLAHNKKAIAEAAELEARRKADKEARQRSWETRRAPMQVNIRRLLAQVDGRWSKTAAHRAVCDYFGEYLRGRIETYPNAPLVLNRWQCTIYFDLIAGKSEPFTTRSAYAALQRRKVKVDEKTAFRDISRWLYQLEEDGYLNARPGYGRYPTFYPTVSGAWW